MPRFVKYFFWYILQNMPNVPRYRIMSDQNFFYECFLLFIPHIVEKFWEDWMKSIGAMVFIVFFFGICCQIWQMYQGIETCETKIFLSTFSTSETSCSRKVLKRLKKKMWNLIRPTEHICWLQPPKYRPLTWHTTLIYHQQVISRDYIQVK